MCIIQVPPKTDTKQLYKIKYLNNIVIKWETLNKKKIIMQCKRCYGHAAPNCNMTYRCVNTPHGPGECSTTYKNNQTNLFCTLCKKIGRPSYKGCEKYIEKCKTKSNKYRLIQIIYIKQKKQMQNNRWCNTNKD